MANKTRKTDAPIVYKEGEEKLVMFGWCSTGHHDGCTVEFPGHKCSCKCHAEDKNDNTEEL